MVYLLKFGASFILPPGIFFVIFFGVAVWCFRRGRRAVAAVLAGTTLVFYLLSTGFVSELLMHSLEGTYVPPKEPQGDVIVLLGGGATKDTPDVDGIGELCGSPANRLLAAARLQRKLHIPILVSGGEVYDDSGAEAKISRRVLVSLGIPDAQILTEEKSITTGENAKFSRKILEAKGLQHPILVTSAYHMPRAVQAFSRVGITVTPYPADYMVNRRLVFHYTKLMPRAAGLENSMLVLQERLRTLVMNVFDF